MSGFVSRTNIEVAKATRRSLNIPTARSTLLIPAFLIQREECDETKSLLNSNCSTYFLVIFCFQLKTIKSFLLKDRFHSMLMKMGRQERER